MKYEKPNTTFMEADLVLLQTSEMEPGATSIGSPSVDDNAKEYSVWDEVEQLNHKEESYEIYE